MSLSTAFYSALTGIGATGRASGVVSENIANALTPGYVRRSEILETQSDVAPGVRMTGVMRHVDPAITASRRSADATLGEAQVLADFRARFVSAVGEVGEEGSITSRLAAFEEALTTAASRPDSVARLDLVAMRANELVQTISDASDTVQAARSGADQKISVEVSRLNELVQGVDELNRRIVKVKPNSSEAASILDQRQAMVDEINTIAPVRIAQRDRGRIALYTDNGVILVDDRAATLEFTPVAGIVAGMEVGGALSELTVNGRVVNMGGSRPALGGGTLAAHFSIRDEIGVAAQAELDSLARDLVERYEDPALDATLAAGSPGLFTDNGLAFTVANEVGLSARLKVNADVDPQQGGESFRLRDGLGAAAPGPVGDASFLHALADALSVQRTPASGNFGSGLLSAHEVGAFVLSGAAARASVAEQRLGFASASQFEISQIELSRGVDTDAELSRMMLIEQSYAANARMLQVVDDLMQTLLRI